jgi:hypothetical protein
MEDLNLPIIKEVIYLPKSLSMDDYFAEERFLAMTGLSCGVRGAGCACPVSC